MHVVIAGEPESEALDLGVFPLPTHQQVCMDYDGLVLLKERLVGTADRILFRIKWSDLCDDNE